MLNLIVQQRALQLSYSFLIFCFIKGMLWHGLTLSKCFIVSFIWKSETIQFSFSSIYIFNKKSLKIVIFSLIHESYVWFYDVTNRKNGLLFFNFITK